MQSRLIVPAGNGAFSLGVQMGRAVARREILKTIAAHDGEYYWYQLDRAISGRHPDCIGPFRAEILELAAEGLIEIRDQPELPGGREVLDY